MSGHLPLTAIFIPPRGVFLYILPLINGHLPPPVSGHNNLWFLGQNPSVKRSNWQRVGKPAAQKSKVGKQKFMEIAFRIKKKKKKRERNTFLIIDKKYDNKLIILMCTFKKEKKKCNRKIIRLLHSFNFFFSSTTRHWRSKVSAWPTGTAWLVFIEQFMKTD